MCLFFIWCILKGDDITVFIIDVNPEKMLSTPRYFDTLPDSLVRGARQHDCDDPKTICLACSITQTCTHKRWRMYEMAYGKPTAPRCVCLFLSPFPLSYIFWCLKDDYHIVCMDDLTRWDCFHQIKKSEYGNEDHEMTKLSWQWLSHHNNYGNKKEKDTQRSWQG